MDFQELIRARYSCRAYEPTLVEREKLEMVLDAGRLAPTADNRQAFRLVVLKTAGREAELRRIYNKTWFVQAPLVIAVVSLPGEAWVRKQDGWNAGDVDAAIVMDHLTLAAADVDLGTCWVCAFDPEAARSVLALYAYDDNRTVHRFSDSHNYHGCMLDDLDIDIDDGSIIIEDRGDR